ncbi:MAG: PSP1 C-terminal domain-containing protein [Planctomycetaceae bacterium]
MAGKILVRYGAIPEVAWCACDLPTMPLRGECVVVASRRGVELGWALEPTAQGGRSPFGGPAPEPGEEPASRVLRLAAPDDRARAEGLRSEAQASFAGWQQRIGEWNLKLELIDLEWMLDRQKLVLYVLGGRGPDTTRLALQAAAAGLAVIEVQPVDAGGIVEVGSTGGCGSGACGCHD